MNPTINLNITATTPEAAIALMQALHGGGSEPSKPEAPVPHTPVQAPTPTAAPATAPAPVQLPAAPPVVPVAAAPTYNRDQIMTAGAALIDAGKINELMGLLNAFGVQAVTQLKQEQLGAFATELRKLGAQI